MDYETAIESFVSRQEAIDELARHGVMADYDTVYGDLFDCVTGEHIATANRYGEYAGADVLAWLGY